MALRRRLGRAFGGISKTLGMLLQNQLIGQRQQELRDAITKAQQEGQIGSEVGKLSESVAGGTRDPEAAQAQLNAVLDMFGRSPSSRPTIDFGSMQPNVAKRTITAMEPITGATAAQQIPEDQDLLTQQIQRRLLASNLETDRPDLMGPSPRNAVPMLPLLTEAMAKRKELLAAEPGSEFKYTDEGGREFQDFKSARERRALGALPTKPTPEQQGQQSLEMWQSFQGTPAYQTGTANQAGLTRGAESRADLAPDIVAGRASQAGQTAAATEAQQRSWVIRDGLPTYGVPRSGDFPFQPHGILSDSQQKEISLLDTVSGLGSEIMDLGTKTKWEGVGGLYAGTIGQTVAAQTGRTTKEAQDLRSKIGNIRATVAALRAGTAFTKTEQELLDTYTPTIDEHPNVIMSKIGALQDFIKRKKADTMSTAALSRGGGVTQPTVGKKFEILEVKETKEPK